ncbi:MAG: hypothetical protein JOY64_14240 [Alphaproteobacteria bacterium]|nr:hypothetical protein [Alphaproteobacteria bacterium]MBV8408791.1 hypothetical protein [Alphaproteobacteria bacterium]
MISVGPVNRFAQAPNGASAPDSITTEHGTFFVEYGNGVPSDGSGGPSTIVQYDKNGDILHAYSIPGSVDGLKYNPETGQIWALQNQDGNSTITLIDPVSHKVTGPLSYAVPSATRGYDDVVFQGDKVFLSYTNPAAPGDPILVELLNGDRPSGALLTSTILTEGTMGFDTVTGNMEVVPAADPDSLKVAPNGDLLLTSGDDGTIIDIQNAGKPNQAVAFTKVQGVPAGAGLDDVIKPSASAGTFYLTDTASNAVYSFHVSGLNPNDYYASVGSLKAFGQIDPTTGAFTPLVTAANAGNMSFAAPHGVVFVPDKNAPPVAEVDSIKVFANAPNGVSGLDSITQAGKFIFVEYGNGVDPTGAVPGTSTIIQYDTAGHVVHVYSIEGSVDGLKFNPDTGMVWALQNQDGRSSLSVIDPKTFDVTHFTYANTSTTRGYDDVVFKGDEVFLSYTNPTGNGDPTIVKLLNGPDLHPGETLETQPVLLDGTMGFDTVTGKTEVVPQADPDSLKLAPNGDLILSSGDDGAIIDIQNPGTAKQAVAFTPIQGIPMASVGSAGLDDVIVPTATAGTFLISDAKDGHVISVHVTGLNLDDYYGSVGAFGAFGQIDKTTGAFTPLVSADNAPGFTFGSPHGVLFIPDKTAPPAPQIGAIRTFQAPTDGSSAPDSVTTADGSTFVEYGNGADSTGAGGSSTIVQYDKKGHIEFTYSLPGSVDGLKINPVTGELWALQNQDGNPTLTLIDPKTHTVSAPLTYADTLATRGYDDVVFKGDKVFLSYTNPVNPGDATVVELLNGDHPTGTLTTKAILAFGATGLDTVTGKQEVVPQNDPDSLKLAPNGDLLLSSGDDGTIIDIKNPGTAQQSVSFTPIAGVTAGHAGLDDVIKPGATSGTFILTDTATNEVLSFHATGLNTNDYYASVGSLHAFGQVDPTTGAFTPLVTADNAPGFTFSSPHGLSFTPDPGQSDDAALANRVDQFSSHMAAAFAKDAGDAGGSAVADAHIDNLVLSHPHG